MERLSYVVSQSKYGAKVAVGVVVSVTRRVTEPPALSFLVTVRGRLHFVPLRTPAVLSANVADITGAWSCSMEEEQGV